MNKAHLLSLAYIIQKETHNEVKWLTVNEALNLILDQGRDEDKNTDSRFKVGN